MKQHPEQKEDERFHTNTQLCEKWTVRDMIGVRIGTTAYDVRGNVLPDYVPIFKTTRLEEHTIKYSDAVEILRLCVHGDNLEVQSMICAKMLDPKLISKYRIKRVSDYPKLLNDMVNDTCIMRKDENSNIRFLDSSSCILAKLSNDYVMLTSFSTKRFTQIVEQLCEPIYNDIVLELTPRQVKALDVLYADIVGLMESQ